MKMLHRAALLLLKRRHASCHRLRPCTCACSAASAMAREFFLLNSMVFSVFCSGVV